MFKLNVSGIRWPALILTLTLAGCWGVDEIRDGQVIPETTENNGDTGGVVVEDRLVFTSENYQIQSDVLDSYECWSQRVILPSKKHVVRFELSRDNAQFHHHIALYKNLNRDSPDGYFNCDIVSSQGWEIVMGLPLFAGSDDMDDIDLPEEAGVLIENGDQIILQMHYHNEFGKDENDNTQVTLHFAEELRPYNSGLLPLGRVNFILPPGQNETSVVGTCDTSNLTSDTTEIISIEEPATAYLSILHMHSLGTEIWTDVVRDGTFVGGEKSGALDINTNWNYNQRLFTDINFVIEPGDILKTTCMYDTSDQTAEVYSGRSSMNEMCWHFVFYYPAIPIPFYPPCGQEFSSF